MPTLLSTDMTPSSDTKRDVPRQEPTFWSGVRFKLETGLRSLTRPFLNIFAFFEADLERTAVAMPPETVLRPRLFHGASETKAVYCLLARLGSSHEEVEKRMVRGDMVSIGFVGEEPVAHVWMTFVDAEIPELDLVLRLQPGEVVQYDTFVAPEWRGRGFQYPLNVPLLTYARQHGYRRTLAWVHVLNTRSFKNQIRSGKRVIQQVISLKIPGMKRRAILRLPGELRSRLIAVR